MTGNGRGKMEGLFDNLLIKKLPNRIQKTEEKIKDEAKCELSEKNLLT